MLHWQCGPLQIAFIRGGVNVNSLRYYTVTNPDGATVSLAVADTLQPSAPPPYELVPPSGIRREVPQSCVLVFYAMPEGQEPRILRLRVKNDSVERIKHMIAPPPPPPPAPKRRGRSRKTAATV
ncbi:MAG: hypothetical protein G01um101425_779 [Candidatus Peregrinibacteria bacterium Gr01-1014_25]|nr:MAG: hypothetical protein G01um101425_779 [Candidatus Peregrinibacteria bacterium Gr01-1014_25]